MKLKAIFCFIIAASFAAAQVPVLQWAKQLEGSSGNSAQGRSVISDASGNVYTTGYFDGKVDFDPGAGSFVMTAIGSVDAFVTKLDAGGNFVWAIQIGGAGNVYANSIALDASGDVYLTGYFDQQTDFDPSASTNNITPLGNNDVFLTKLDAGGNFLWAAQLGGSGADAFGNGITVDVNGDVLATGYFYGGAVDFDPDGSVFNLTPLGADVFIVKLKQTGNFLWAVNMESGGTAVGNSIITDANADVYTTGYFDSKTDFDPSTILNTIIPLGNNDIFVSKLDANGNYVWGQQLGGSGADAYGQAITIDLTGDVYTTGYFYGGAVDFDPDGPTYNLTPLITDVFISKLDPTIGKFLWAVQMESNSNAVGTGISTDSNGDVYTSGYFDGKTDFDPGASVVNITPLGNNDIFISKLDNGGNYIWAKQLGGSGADAIGYAISVDASINIYTTGWFTSVVDFDPDASLYNLSTPNPNEIFIHKLSLCGVAAPTNTTPIANLTKCSNNTTTLSVGGAGTFKWYATATSTTALGSGSSYVTPVLTVGTYTYFAESFSCAVSATRTAISVVVNANPTVNISANQTTICAGNSSTLSATGANSYTWSTSATTSSIVVTPSSSQVYTVTGTSLGCTNTKTISITVNINTVVVSVSANPTLVCSGSSSSITASGANTYLWNTSATTSSIIVSPSSTMVYTVTGTSFGCSNVKTVTLAVNPSPTIGINSNPVAVCPGSSASLTANGANSYTWSTAATTTVIIVTPTTTSVYTVTGTSTLGCNSSKTISLVVNPNPTVTAVANPTTVCAGVTSTLTGGGATTYTWNPGGSGTAIAVNPTTTTTYTLTGTNGNGCNNTKTLTLVVSPCTGINQVAGTISEINVYPNPFNNKINIMYNGTKQAVQILNTLGSIIYEAVIEDDKMEIDLINQAPGIYFIRIGSATQKIIKE